MHKCDTLSNFPTSWFLPLDRNGYPKAWRFCPQSKWQSFVHLDEKPMNWHRPRVPKMFVDTPRFANPIVEWFYLPSQSRRLGCLAAVGWVRQCRRCDHPDFEFSSCWAHPNALFSYRQSQWPPTRHLESDKRKGNPRNLQTRWLVWPHPKHPGYWCRTPSACCPYPHRQRNFPKERKRQSSPRQIARVWSSRLTLKFHLKITGKVSFNIVRAKRATFTFFKMPKNGHFWREVLKVAWNLRWSNSATTPVSY